MNEQHQFESRPELRDLLAAERTFLAWIRTGLALMGFGFVVARFGLFLQQLQFLQHPALPPTYGWSLWFGTALIATGVVVFLQSAWHHVRLIRGLNRGEPTPSRPSMEAILIALFLAAVGIAMAIYLISVHTSTTPSSESDKEMSVTPASTQGFITMPGNHSVDQTLDRPKNIFEAKGITQFAFVDHSGEAEKKWD